MAYTTLGVHPDHGQRARELAKHLGMPTAAYIGALIDQQYKAVFGREPTERLPLTVRASATDWRATKLMIETPTGQMICVPSIYVKRVADQLHKCAETGGASLDLDIPKPLTISRKGSGVVIEAEGDDGHPARLTLGVTQTKRLSERMLEMVASYAADALKH